MSLLKGLMTPVGIALGAAGTEFVMSRLPIPRGVGPSGPVPLSPIARWGIPLGVLLVGGYLGKKTSGGMKALALGVAVNGAAHAASNISDSIDVNYGGSY